ncbi:MAG TPA: S9 family peptidase [Terracidiphilus sp.]|nr:S9 family peptidase [Terracidiphilus sp.]
MRRLTFLALLIASTLAPAQTKRPMTFEDMMHMKRLGSTAVSSDGKWLGYSVTTVDLDKNTKTMELWLQPVSGGDPIKLAVGQPGDDGLEFSPDGHSVLFLSGREDGQQVWSADFDTATGATTNAMKLTAISTEADNAKWSPDSKSIVFTSAVYPDCPAITTADAKTGDECNRDRDKAAAQSKVKARIFTHLMYRHWNHFTGEKRSHLFFMDVATGALRDLNPNDPHDVPPEYPTEPLGCGCAFSPDSKELAITMKDVPDEAISTNADIFTLDLTNPSAKPVKVSTSPGGDFNPAYSPDGKYLAWRSQARAGYESDKFRLALYDRSAKTIKYLLPSFGTWVDEFIWESTWTDGTQHILFVSGEKGESALYLVDVNGQNVRRRYGQVPGEWSDIHYAIWSAPSVQGRTAGGMDRISHDYDLVIGSLMRVDRPSEVVAADFAKMNDDVQQIIFKKAGDPSDSGRKLPLYEPLQVTHLNDALFSELDLPKMESFWFNATDGTKVQGFLIRPPGFDPAKKYPVKFLIHGGPQGAWGDSWSYRWNAQLFAANGYVVVMINPRGSTGYGQAFVDGVNSDWGGKPFTDLMTGLDYAEQHYPFIDKSRECALGASYGGYMANWILGHTDRFKCIVSHDGMFNAESAFGTTEEDWFNIWEFKGRPWDYYGKPDSENPFRKWSPSLYTKNFKTPTLVVHGQLDFRLDVSEGFQLFNTLQMLNVPSKMLYFPDEGHWVLKPQDSQLWYKTVNDWVDQWVKQGGRE